MVFFFTSVGFQANLKVLKSGGRALIVFLGLVITLILCQNFLAIGLAKLLHISPLVGLCTGSIPMIGGHGTAGAFGPVLEDFGVKGASTLCTAAATFGLIAGSVMGGPVGKRLIEKKNLLDTVVVEDDSLLIEDERKHERHASMYPAAVFQLIIAIGIGTIISKLLSLTGMTFPIYIGAMIAAACMRNIGEYSGKFTIYMGEINDIGGAEWQGRVERIRNQLPHLYRKVLFMQRRYMFVCLLRTVVRTMMAIPSQIRLAFVKTIWQSRQT